MQFSTIDSICGFGFFLPKPDTGGEPSSAPIDKLSSICRKPRAGEFCRAVMQTFYFLLTVRRLSCVQRIFAGLVLRSLFANHSITVFHFPSMVTLLISFFTNTISNNGRITKHLSQISNLQ